MERCPLGTNPELEMMAWWNDSVFGTAVSPRRCVAGLLIGSDRSRDRSTATPFVVLWPSQKRFQPKRFETKRPSKAIKDAYLKSVQSPAEAIQDNITGKVAVAVALTVR